MSVTTVTDDPRILAKLAKNAKAELDRLAHEHFYAKLSEVYPLDKEQALELYKLADSLAQGNRAKAGHGAERLLNDAIDYHLGFTAVHRQKRQYEPFQEIIDGYIESTEAHVGLSCVAGSTRERKPALWPSEASRLQVAIQAGSIPPGSRLYCVQRDDLGKAGVDQRVIARLQVYPCARFMLMSCEDHWRGLFAFLDSLTIIPVTKPIKHRVVGRGACNYDLGI